MRHVYVTRALPIYHGAFKEDSRIEIQVEELPDTYLELSEQEAESLLHKLHAILYDVPLEKDSKAGRPCFGGEHQE